MSWHRSRCTGEVVFKHNDLSERILWSLMHGDNTIKHCCMNCLNHPQLLHCATFYHPISNYPNDRAMAGSVAAVVGICVLVVMAMLADSSAAGVCNPNALYPCLNAIQGARPTAPSKQCCNVVRSVDKVCMCNQLKSSSFPAQMVTNGLQLPKKCGRTDLRGFKCGRYTFPF